MYVVLLVKTRAFLRATGPPIHREMQGSITRRTPSMQLCFSRTKPFRNLQKHIGSSTYRLNTIFVGLDCVAKSQGDSGAIAVTWKKPSKDKSTDVANQAKIFACTSALMLGADVVDAYIREIVAQKGLEFSPKSFEIATKATTGPSGNKYSFADRVTAIAKICRWTKGLGSPV